MHFVITLILSFLAFFQPSPLPLGAPVPVPAAWVVATATPAVPAQPQPSPVVHPKPVRVASSTAINPNAAFMEVHGPEGMVVVTPGTDIEPYLDNDDNVLPDGTSRCMGYDDGC